MECSVIAGSKGPLKQLNFNAQETLSPEVKTHFWILRSAFFQHIAISLFAVPVAIYFNAISLSSVLEKVVYTSITIITSNLALFLIKNDLSDQAIESEQKKPKKYSLENTPPIEYCLDVLGTIPILNTIVGGLEFTYSLGMSLYYMTSKHSLDYESQNTESKLDISLIKLGDLHEKEVEINNFLRTCLLPQQMTVLKLMEEARELNPENAENPSEAQVLLWQEKTKQLESENRALNFLKDRFHEFQEELNLSRKDAQLSGLQSLAVAENKLKKIKKDLKSNDKLLYHVNHAWMGLARGTFIGGVVVGTASLSYRTFHKLFFSKKPEAE